MTEEIDRRVLLRSVITAGAGIGFGGVHLQRSAAAEKASSLLAPEPRTEALVFLLEKTPRDQVLEKVGAKIREGATYDDVLAALILAGVREVQPRPSVGFQFHTVLGVLSYHHIRSELPAEDQWLPVFWGIDYFKSAQSSDERQGDWKMPPVDESAVPLPDQAARSLVEAMHAWNEPEADAAAAAVARHLPPQQAFELFYPLGSRDFRSIGHKAIFVMGAQRVLQQIGWRHAEPIMRSLAYALLMHDDGNPADRDDPADQPWRRNQRIAGKIRNNWQDGGLSREATAELLSVFHNGSPEDAADSVIARINAGASPVSVWDAIFCGAAELQLRQPNIVSLHAVTTSRAIHYAYQTTTQEATRRLLLLQNASLLPMFRDSAAGRGGLAEMSIEGIEAIPPEGTDETAIRDIVDGLSGARRQAAGRILGYLEANRSQKPLLSRIRQLLAYKAGGVHDYKFTSAALEDFQHVSKPWRNRYLACGAMHFRGSDGSDNSIVRRTRQALSG
ncbi:MAG: hypothetical protein GXY83_05980 [Rhodopirellula sp.]|nr:hypothetical protein [Rhodopirellula sp.]